MRVTVLVALAACLPTPVAAQVDARKAGELIAADFRDRVQLETCSIDSAAASVSGRMHVRFQPDQRSASGAGVDLAVTPGTDGSPTVSAHAINTKGTGAQNGRLVVQPCAAVRSSSARPAVPSCVIEGGPETMDVLFVVPLAVLAPEPAAKTYVGHVTLMKRGPDGDQSRMITTCTAGGGKKGYDYYLAR